jgi:hypothetical protein
MQLGMRARVEPQLVAFETPVTDFIVSAAQDIEKNAFANSSGLSRPCQKRSTARSHAAVSLRGNSARNRERKRVGRYFHPGQRPLANARGCVRRSYAFTQL